MSQETYLTFVEGTSSKFWKANLDGVTLTVQWGKIGTAGQSQEKTFGTDAEALAAFEKQKAEKVKKGYAEGEDGSAAVATPPAAPSTPVVKSAPAEKKTPPAKPVPTEVVEPRISLQPEDYARIAWKTPPTPKPRPAVKPFDLTECLDRLDKVAGAKERELWSWKWEKLLPAHGLSREEAHFLLEAIQAAANFSSKDAVKQHLSKRNYDGSWSLPANSTYYTHWNGMPRLFTASVWVLHGPDGLLDFLTGANDYQVSTLCESVETELFPTLTLEERTEFRDAVARHLLKTQPAPHWLLWLGAVLGADPQLLRQVVAGWPDGSGKPEYVYTHYTNNHTRIIVGLGDRETIVHELRRTKAWPSAIEDVKAILAATDFACLDVITDGICEATKKAEAEKLAKTMLLAEGPETAVALATLAVSSKVPHLARDWWEKFPVFAIQGLATICGEKSKRGEVALEWLRGLRRRGETERIEAALAERPESLATVREKVLDAAEEKTYPLMDDASMPDWLREAFGGKLKIPDAPAEANPPVRLSAEHDALPQKPAAAAAPLPKPAPFDLEACLARLAKVASSSQWAYQWRWKDAQIALPMSREEAGFWLHAVKHSTGSTLPTVEKLLRNTDFTKDFPKSGYQFGVPELIPVLWTYLKERAVTFIANINQHQLDEVIGALDSLLSQLTESDWAKIRTVLEEQLKSGKPSIGLLVFAGRIGVAPEQIAASIAATPKLKYRYERNGWLPIVYGLGDPEKMVAEARRLDLYPANAEQARLWLATAGLGGLDIVASGVEESWSDKVNIARVLLAIEAPEVVEALLTIRRFSTVKPLVREWFMKHPAHAITGLIRVVIGNGKQAKAAADQLYEYTAKGYGWLIEQKVAELPAELQAAHEMRMAARKITVSHKEKALAALVPPILVQGTDGIRRLTPDQMAYILAELRSATLEGTTPGLLRIREKAERASVDAFVWAIFQDWLQSGASSKERWKMEALGHLGGDATALQLAPLIRVWPGESQHQRAVLGLDVLRAIGTDTALMQIQGISEKVSFKGIKERAKESLGFIADERGLSKEELADRIVPTCELDERGTRVFDFGPRKFTFTLGPDLKPALKDETGKRLPDLPKPNTKDDTAKATEAVAAWKLLKKQVAEVAKTQATRLEQVMVVGRRWTPTEFAQLIVEHPLMGLLAQRLIWAAYDETGTLVQTFRVADDRTLADTQDDFYTFPESVKNIGIIHPAYLPEEARGIWGELLSDYELIPPFVQLGRPIYTLTDAEKDAKAITRFAGIKDIDPKTLLFGLDNLGWQRGTPQDGGWFTEHHKFFPSANVYAVVSYHGAPVGYMDGWEDQEVNEIFFLQDANEATGGWVSSNGAKSLVALKDIDPIIASEVLYDITRLVEKGRKS